MHSTKNRQSYLNAKIHDGEINDVALDDRGVSVPAAPKSSSFSWQSSSFTRMYSATVAALLLPLWLLVSWLWTSGLPGAECLRCIVWSVSLPFFFPTSLPLPLRLGSGSLRPCRHREPVRLPFWLLARFVDALAPFACTVRCPHGSTMRFSTTSSVYSTHHFLRTLNSLPSSLQRISLALPSLLLHHALPGPQLLFLLLAPTEPFSPLACSS